MKEKVKLGIIGLGARGKNMLEKIFSDMQDVEIAIVCDRLQAYVERSQDFLKEKCGIAVDGTLDWRDVVAREDIDAVVIFTSWALHADIAVAAMNAGKYVGTDVGGVYDVSDCWRLIDAYEKTGSHLMMLENCCYGRKEMLALRMAKENLFGEIVHCTGAYMHDLRHSDLRRKNPNTYRLKEYENRCADTYPTHALGPICKILGINRGNRMMYLTSMASKARGLMDYWNRFEEEGPVEKTEIKQGDIVITNIMCANGATIMLRLDTTLPRAYYSRDISVRGTRGAYDEAREVVFLDGMEEGVKENQEEFFEKYDHPLHAEYVKKGEKAGHGGMDWLVGRAFIESVKREIPTPIDTYDTVAWMAITPLTEQSIALGSAPIPIPDFTRGKWMRRDAPLRTKYSLDVITEDKETPIY